MAFEKFKEKYLEKLKRNTVISELKGEKVYLAKGSSLSWLPIIGKRMKEWKQIYPIVDEETMEIKWINFIIGGKRNLVKLLAVLIVVGFVLLQFFENYRLLGQALECCNKFSGIIIP